VRINKKYEKREANREASALKAAQLERAIEKELLNRLKVGTFYKNIYNLDQKEFNDKLDENEVDDQTQYEIADENEELSEEDDSEIGGDLELNEEERAMLEMADIDDIEDLAEEDIKETLMAGKKRRKPVKIQLEQEMEYEFENQSKQKATEQIKVKHSKKQK
jgi:protein MAK16